MSRIGLRSRVGADGVPRVIVPVGAAEADGQMQVTIESIPSEDADQSYYADWLDGISGKWQ
jgi:hypothetical protein